MNIDLNADTGESFGVYSIGADNELMPYITSANIACGFHGGDPRIMSRTVSTAKAHGVAVGAHPGYGDLAGFGRRSLKLSETEIESMVLYQLGALYAFAHTQGVTLRHVRPHGAFYADAVQDLQVARPLARAVTRFDSQLILVGQPNSAIIEAAEEFGLRAAREGYIDRAYKSDGTLLPRHESSAVIASPARAVAVAMQLVREQTMRTVEGRLIKLEVDTISINSDTPRVIEIARAVHEALVAAGVKLQPMLS